MHRSRGEPFNPILAAKREARANLAADIAAQPVVSALIAVIGLCSMALGLAVLHAELEPHAATIFDGLQRWRAGVWAAMFCLPLAILVPLAYRDRVEAETGWLSALPQMPQAMRRWSRWRSFAWALLLALLLLVGIISVHRLAPGANTPTVLDCLPAMIGPMLAWLLAPLLAKSRPLSPPTGSTGWRGHQKAAKCDPRSVLAHWQWSHYRSRRWTTGTRWWLGVLVLVVPAGMSFIQVGVVLGVGFLVLQWFQLWSASLRVIVQASALTGALPIGAWTFVGEVSRLPMGVAASLALFAFAVLASLGLPIPAALLVALVIFGALTLQAATVLARRHRPRLLELHSLAVLLCWVMISQAVPFMMPLVWLALCAWLLRLAGREAP